MRVRLRRKPKRLRPRPGSTPSGREPAAAVGALRCLTLPPADSSLRDSAVTVWAWVVWAVWASRYMGHFLLKSEDFREELKAAIDGERNGDMSLMRGIRDRLEEYAELGLAYTVRLTAAPPRLTHGLTCCCSCGEGGGALLVRGGADGAVGGWWVGG